MLQNRTITGVLWNFLEQLSKRGISIIVTLILARFLVPEDFGLMAMMAVFVAIATALMDSGIKQAVIRKQNANQDDFNTAFYANLALGGIAYLTLFATAPMIADFYQEPRLVTLIRVAGVVVLIDSFRVIQTAILSRELNFKAQLQAIVPGTFISGISAVAIAYAGGGVWALVAQMIISATIVTLLLWFLVRWRPTLSFDKTSLKEMYSFGYKLFLSGLLETTFKNIYVIVIAKIFSSAIAGLYFFAERIKDLVVNQLVIAIQTVTYPALSSVQDDDVKLKAGYRKVLQATTFFIFPAVLMLAALAEPLFQVIFPERWLAAVPYLQLMCIAAVLYPLHSINLNILKVKGRSDLFLGLEVFKKAVLCLLLFLTFRYGVTAILVGRIVQSILAYIPNCYFSSRLIDYRIREQLSDVMPTLLLSIVISGSAYMLVRASIMPPLLKLLLFGFVGLFLYLLIAKLMKLESYQLAEGVLVQRLGWFQARKGEA